MRASFRLVALVIDYRSHRSMGRWRRNTWRWTCACYAAAHTSSNNHNHLDGLIDYSDQYPMERNRLEEKVLSPMPKADDFSFLSEAVVAVETDSHAEISRNRCYNSGEYDDAILISEAIMGTDDALNSTGGSSSSSEFSEQTQIFLRQFRGKLNQSLVIRVLKLLRKPNLCSRFFRWSSRQIGYCHSEPVYDTLLEVLGFDKNTKIPHNLLKEIGEDDREVLRRLLDVLVKKCCRNGFWNEALEELGRLKDFGYRPSQATYCSLIVVLLEVNKIDSAFLVHKEMSDSGHLMDYLTMGCFVSSLCKVGRWSEALSTMKKENFKPDTVIYTKMIGGLLEASLFDKAMSFLQLMRSESCLPNSFTYSTLLSGFLKKKQFGYCKRVINTMIKEGCRPNPELFHLLLHSYCSSGDYAYAYKLLNKMLSYGCKPGYVAYNIFIGGVCGQKCLPSNSDFQLAEKAFVDMLDAGFILNKVNVDNYTRCLCGTGKFDKAYMVIKDLISKGFVSDAYTYTKVIEHLCQANKVEKSLLLFEEMKENGVVPDVYTYTILIDSFSKAGLLQQAKSWFDEMIQKGCAPNVVTYTTLIHAYLKARQPSDADKLFERMLNAGCQPTVITYTALIDGLCKVGKVGKAWQVYCRMQGSADTMDSNKYFKDNATSIPEPNVFTYGALVDGLCKIHKAAEATNLLEAMSSAGCEPNDVVYDAFIDGLCKTGKLDEAQKVLVRMVEQGYSPTIHTYTTFIDSLFKDKRLDLALKVLSRMLENSCAPNVVTYTAMVDGLCKLDKTEEAYELLLMMEEKGCKPNIVTYTAIIDGFGRIGKIEKCLDLFRQLTEKGCSPNAITYRVLINHCCAAGRLDEAHNLLEEMKQTYWSGNLVNYSTLIQGFSREFLISLGLLEEMSKDGFEPVVPVYCLLIDNLLKSGRLKVALELYMEFTAIPFAHLTPEGRQTFSYLIEALCSIHKVDEALELYVDFSKKGGITELNILFHLIKGLIKVGKLDETFELCYCICQMATYWHPEDEGHHGNEKL